MPYCDACRADKPDIARIVLLRGAKAICFCPACYKKLLLPLEKLLGITAHDEAELELM